MASGDSQWGQYVKIGNVDGEISTNNCDSAENECARQIALRLVKFRRHHGHIVPAVIGPQGADHGGEKSGNAAPTRNRRSEMREVPASREETHDNDSGD